MANRIVYLDPIATVQILITYANMYTLAKAYNSNFLH
jgi:hypothetical protein